NSWLPETVQQDDLYLPKRPEPPDPALASLISSADSIWFIDTKMQAENALLAILFALRAYKMEHGAYPKTLTQIAGDGKYLKKVPRDPFEFGTYASMPVYKRVGDKYLLYSVGPDGKDNGGKPIEKAGTQ